jgi:hypothetical protein
MAVCWWIFGKSYRLTHPSGGVFMPAKKDSVTTPLHLLQQLSHSLVVHLQKACSEALKDAEVLLAKLEKERGKTQEKVVKARAKLDDAGNAGKSKAQTKARAKLAELDDMLAVLQARQSETLNYLSCLKRDAEQSLKLAQGITQVENAAAQALASRDKPAASHSADRSTASSRAVTSASAKSANSKAGSGQASPASASRPATSRAKPAATPKKPVDAKEPPAKAPTLKAPSPSRRRPASSAGKPATTAEPASAAKPAAAKKPAARKPAAAKRQTVAQPSPAAS